MNSIQSSDSGASNSAVTSTSRILSEKKTLNVLHTLTNRCQVWWGSTLKCRIQDGSTDCIMTVGTLVRVKKQWQCNSSNLDDSKCRRLLSYLRKLGIMLWAIFGRQDAVLNIITMYAFSGPMTNSYAVQMLRFLNSVRKLGTQCSRENRTRTLCKYGLVHAIQHFTATTFDCHNLHWQSPSNSGDTPAISIFICTRCILHFLNCVSTGVHIVLTTTRQVDLLLTFSS